MAPFATTFLLTKLGFAITFLSGFILIYLTIAHIKNMVPTYKRIIVYFAGSGILFSALEVISRPFAHNYNGAIVFFSVSTVSSHLEVLQALISIWAGFYALTIAFVSVQFIYRYVSLFHSEKLEYFDGWLSVVWMTYPVIPGAIYSVVFHICTQPDDYADEYVRQQINETYELSISEVSRFALVPYDDHGNIRWKGIFNISVDIFLITFHYLIVLYCGLRMHFNMKTQLKKFSVQQGKLQKQFFKALVIQSLGPTLFLIIPAAPVLLTPVIAPLVNVEVSWQTGWMFTLIGLYPPFDSIAFMLIVSEYKHIVQKKMKRIGVSISSISASQVSTSHAYSTPSRVTS